METPRCTFHSIVSGYVRQRYPPAATALDGVLCRKVLRRSLEGREALCIRLWLVPWTWPRRICVACCVKLVSRSTLRGGEAGLFWAHDGDVCDMSLGAGPLSFGVTYLLLTLQGVPWKRASCAPSVVVPIKI